MQSPGLKYSADSSLPSVDARTMETDQELVAVDAVDAATKQVSNEDRADPHAVSDGL